MTSVAKRRPQLMDPKNQSNLYNYTFGISDQNVQPELDGWRKKILYFLEFKEVLFHCIHSLTT